MALPKTVYYRHANAAMRPSTYLGRSLFYIRLENPFVWGMGQNVISSTKIFSYEPTGVTSANNLRKDWEAVGDYLATAMRKHNE